MASTNTSPDVMSELLQTLIAKFDVLEEKVAALSADSSCEARLPTRTRQALEPVSIPRPPETAQANRSTATCKPPREPSLTGDKQFEWQEFEREFLRYFRITQGYYLEPEVQVDLLLMTAGDKVRKIFYQLPLSADHYDIYLAFPDCRGLYFHHLQ